jgi:hypothetical protein
MHAKTRFEPRDHLADRRTREVHAFSRKRKAACLNHLHKDCHPIKPVSHIDSMVEQLMGKDRVNREIYSRYSTPEVLLTEPHRRPHRI